MVFKLFKALLALPEIAFLFGFVIFILIFIVFKLGILEKILLKLEEKSTNLENRISELEKMHTVPEEEEPDIIDKFLQQRNVDSILNAGKDCPIKTDKVLKDSKISSILDPREGE